ncbi:MAG: Flp pilus assembly protein CpaB [Corticimicrobacter sp.]|uniref:Flp pilus assembly protein CpaB n=1 Tax=Corticimicrobacter sp. TaxID=2678536 RepID=UPI0032DA5F56
MSRLHRILAVILVLLALLLGLWALHLARTPATPAPQPALESAQDAPAPVLYPVVLAARAIDAGQVLTTADLRVEYWPARPVQAFDDPSTLIGASMRHPHATGEPLLASSLKRGLAHHLAPDERALTIPIDDIVGAGRHILPGDHVDVFITLNRSNEVSHTQSRLLMPRLRVLAYGQQTLETPEPAPASSTMTRGTAQPAAIRSAILAVPVGQVNELLLATRNGKLQLVLRAPDDTALPDTELFAPRNPVLTGRSDLTTQERTALDSPNNQAYAGESLPQLAGNQQPASRQQERTRPAPTSTAPRSLEVIRAGQRETVHY